MAISIADAKIAFTPTIQGAFTGLVFTRNTSYDQTYYVDAYDTNGNPGKGIIAFNFGLSGSWPNLLINVDPIAFNFTIEANHIPGLVLGGTPIAFNFGIKAGDAYGNLPITTEFIKNNYVEWAKIGDVDFTIWKDNEAGNRFLDWPGWVYCIKKHKNRPVVYGQNGVSVFPPAPVGFGLQTIYKIGLKGKQAVTGDDNDHYFVDNKGYLFHLGESLEMLDYHEFLAPMAGSIVMSYDNLNYLIYICDGTYGYIYSIKDKSLGQGPVNITGIGWQNGILYAAASGTVTMPPFSIVTTIQDMNTRKEKTIYGMEIASHQDVPLQGAVDYRWSSNDAFFSTPWVNADRYNRVWVYAKGIEFRFKVKSLAYQQFKTDRISAIGRVN